MRNIWQTIKRCLRAIKKIDAEGDNKSCVEQKMSYKEIDLNLGPLILMLSITLNNDI